MSTTQMTPSQPDGSVSSEVGRSPDFIDRMWQFAEKVCGAKFISRSVQGDAASTFFLVATSQDLGLRWTHGLRSLYMTPDGKVGLQGDVMLALLLGRGFKVSFEGSDKTKGVCQIERPDGQSQSWTFSMDDAAAIRRYDYDAKAWRSLADKPNYKNYPKNMLMWRALANCARFIAADLLGGIYLPDELEDIAEPPPTAHPEESDTELSVGVKPSPSNGTPPEPSGPVPTPDPQPSPTNNPPGDNPPSTTPTEDTQTLKERIAAVKRLLGGSRTADRIVNEFFRGWLGTDVLPKSPEAYFDPVAKLEEIVTSDVDSLLNDPRGAGRRARRPEADALADFAAEHGWGPDTVSAAKAVASKLNMSQTDLLSWFEVLGLPSLPVDDIHAFLTLAQQTRRAHLLLDIAAKRQRPASELAKTLRNLSADDILKRLDQWEIELLNDADTTQTEVL